jgi:hypothetical protein
MSKDLIAKIGADVVAATKDSAVVNGLIATAQVVNPGGPLQFLWPPSTPSARKSQRLPRRSAQNPKCERGKGSIGCCGPKGDALGAFEVDVLQVANLDFLRGGQVVDYGPRYSGTFGWSQRPVSLKRGERGPR